MDKVKIATQVVAAVVAVAALFGVVLAPEVLDGIRDATIGVVSILGLVSTFLPSLKELFAKKEGTQP